MPNDVKAYLQKLAQDSGLDADAQTALLKALENEKFAGAVSDSVAMRADYSRNMDSLRSQQQAFEKQQNEWSTWYKTALAQDAARQTELDTYRTRFGELNGNGGGNGGTPAFDQSAFEKRILEETEKRIRAAQQVNITITKEAVKAGNDYYARFGKPLDVDGLEKYAIENNLPLRTAYEQFISTEVKAKTDAETAARIEREVKEKVTAELSKHNIPTDPVPTEKHVFFDRPIRDPNVAKPDERAQMSAFKDAWNTASHVTP